MYCKYSIFNTNKYIHVHVHVCKHAFIVHDNVMQILVHVHVQGIKSVHAKLQTSLFNVTKLTSQLSITCICTCTCTLVEY